MHDGTRRYKDGTIMHFIQSLKKFLDFVHSFPTTMYRSIGGGVRKANFQDIQHALKREQKKLRKGLCKEKSSNWGQIRGKHNFMSMLDEEGPISINACIQLTM